MRRLNQPEGTAMSHFTVVQTQIVDQVALVAALADQGFGEVERHASPQALFGYEGDRRAETADVIVRRKHIGAASNDIGFRRLESGAYQAIISEYDRQEGYDQGWLDTLTQRYAYHVVVKKLGAQGFKLVQEENRQDGQLKLTLQRWG
jgi:hypothetical protein